MARSQRGLWVKGEIIESDDDGFGINIYWQRRHVTKGNKVHTIDENGQVDGEYSIYDFRWFDEWELSGTIEIIDEMVEFCGIQNFDKFLQSYMKHAVDLIACGYGESSKDVVEWFNSFDTENIVFIVDGEYLFVNSHGIFSDFIGRRCSVFFNDDRKMVVKISVNHADFDVIVDNNDDLLSFLLSTKPV